MRDVHICLCSIESPNNSTSLEEIRVSPDTVAKAGDDVFLGCAAKGANVKYHWTRKSLLGDNRTHQLERADGFLELTAVNLDDSGAYECEAYTEHDNNRKILKRSATILLTVKGA